MRYMLAFACVVCVVTTFACGAGDDTSDGNRSDCSHGGPLAQCPAFAPTAEGACTKLVQCGAIPEQRPTGPDHQYDFDWDRCVDTLEGQDDTAQSLIIDCVEVETCDLLRSTSDKNGYNPNSPDASQIACLRIGAR